mgnify:CR=1 FL=1
MATRSILAVVDGKGSFATFADEIEAFDESTEGLDKTMAEATARRKEENSDFKILFAPDSAAKETLAFNMNRLQPEAVQTFGAHSKQSEGSGGVD